MSAETIVARGVTDVGRVRKANEDAFFVGDHLVAVADGMGGHLAGEVASATALEPVEELDGQRFPDSGAALEALREAVVAANTTVSRMAADEPAYRGMGTTLTIGLIEGRRLHVAHVGDSRAYLFRGGRFTQLTDDHTLVQHLVDEGQITRAEAANHPQRSIITRAIGVSPDIEVDTQTLDLEPGDQLLLCSDGLTGVVDDDAIARELAADDDADTIVTRLVDAANAGGGPDNVTVVLVRFGDPGAGTSTSTGASLDGEDTGPLDGPDPADGHAGPPASDGDGGAGGGAGRAAPVLIGTRTERGDVDWAERLGNYGAMSPTGGGSAVVHHDEVEPAGAGRRVGRAVAVLLVVALLVALAVVGGRFLLDRSYFVGLDDGQVVIHRGIDMSLGPLELSSVFERSDLTVDDVPAWYARTLEDGITAADLTDARRIVENAPRSDAADAATDDATDDRATDGGADTGPGEDRADAGADDDADVGPTP